MLRKYNMYVYKEAAHYVQYVSKLICSIALKLLGYGTFHCKCSVNSSVLQSFTCVNKTFKLKCPIRFFDINQIWISQQILIKVRSVC
jgi:hypothetical protein